MRAKRWDYTDEAVARTGLLHTDAEVFGFGVLTIPKSLATFEDQTNVDPNDVSVLHRLGTLRLRPVTKFRRAMTLACSIDDLAGPQCVLHGSKRPDVFGGVVFQDDEIRLETGGDSSELF